MEAATFEMCHSPCWESKVLSQVYWVHSHQVSKTPPTGMFISTGSFIIRGKRNFITPQKLELGFTVMFCLGEESLAEHLNERKTREELAEIESAAKVEDEEMPELVETAEPPLKRQSSSQVTVSQQEGDDDDIKVVQVGEAPRVWKDKPAEKQPKQQQQQSKKSNQQANQKNGKQNQKMDAEEYWKS